MDDIELISIDICEGEIEYGKYTFYSVIISPDYIYLENVYQLAVL